MSCVNRYRIFWLLGCLLLWFPVVDAFDKHLCKSCVLNDCKYCRVPPDYIGGDKCLCPDQEDLPMIGSIFTCDDYYTGAVTISSRTDCVFRSQDGEFLTAVLVIGMLIGVSCCVYWTSGSRRTTGEEDEIPSKADKKQSSTWFRRNKAAVAHDTSLPPPKGTVRGVVTADGEKLDLDENKDLDPIIAVATRLDKDGDMTDIREDDDVDLYHVPAITVRSSSTNPSRIGGHDDTEIEVVAPPSAGV